MDERKKFKLVWYEGTGSPACVAYADSYDIRDGILFFNSDKPIVMSKEVRFIIK